MVREAQTAARFRLVVSFDAGRSRAAALFSPQAHAERVVAAYRCV